MFMLEENYLNKFYLLLTGFIVFVFGILGLDAHEHGVRFNFNFDPEAKKIQFNETDTEQLEEK